MQKRIAPYVCVLVSILTVSVSLAPVEQAWSSGDILLSSVTAAVLSLSIVLWPHLKLRRVDMVLAAWYVYVCVYAYVQSVYPVAHIVLRATLLFSLFYALRSCLVLYKRCGDMIALLIVLAALVEAGCGIYQIIMGYSRNNHFLMTGTFQNPGPYATMLACGLVALVALVKKYEKTARALRWAKAVNGASMLVAIVLLSMLLATLSRAALLAATLCLLCMHRDKVRRHLLLGGVILVVSFCLLYLVKRGSADSRVIIWWVSVHNITEHPILGTGIGSFLHQYAEGMAALSATKPDGYFNVTDVVQYAFNDILYIGVEQGIIGMLFALSFILALACEARKADSAVKWVLPVVFITSLFSYTFELLPFQIVTVAACASLFAGHDERAKGGRVTAIPFLTVAFFLALFTFSYIRERVDASAHYRKIRGILTAEYAGDYYRLHPYMLDNANFLFDYARILSNAMRMNASNGILRECALVSADPMVYVLLANNCWQMGEASLAEKYYLKAFSVMPNRVYPLYKLMMLYEQTGRHDKALPLAERIVDFPVKVSSMATKNIQDEARKVITK